MTSFSLWRHSRVSRLRRSQPRSHYDVIRYWAGHAQRYRRTYGHVTAFNIWTCRITVAASRCGVVSVTVWCCVRPDVPDGVDGSKEAKETRAKTRAPAKDATEDAGATRHLSSQDGRKEKGVDPMTLQCRAPSVRRPKRTALTIGRAVF